MRRSSWIGGGSALFTLALVTAVFAGRAGVPSPTLSAPPEVFGEITGFAASPDGERVAFVVERDAAPASLHLLDLKFGMRLAEAAIEGDLVSRELAWSPDSSYVCLREPDDHPFALSRDGRRQSLHLSPRSSGSPLWKGSPAATLVYQASHGEGEGLFELDVRSGKCRLVRPVDRLGLELHSVRGKPCYVTLDREQPGKRGRSVRVRRIDDGSPVFRLWLPRQDGPVPDPADWDGPALSVSPDGRFFFVAGQVSASTFDLLGRVDEAASLFRKPHHAIAYLTGLFDGHSVQWVPPSGKTQWALLKERSSGRLSALIDPETGARYEKRFPGVTFLELLPDGDQLGVDSAGLALSTSPTLDWNPKRRLVRVRKAPGQSQ